MFTIYIHVLEVLAMHSQGADMCTIGNMGLCFSMVQIQKAVRELEKDGFITRHRTAGGRVYKLTEKAIEYCENVTRAYARVHDVNIVDKSILDAEMLAQEAPKDASSSNETPLENVVTGDTKEGFIEVYETPPSLNILTSTISFPLYGDKTIAEYVKEIESASYTTVERADYVDGVVTLTIQTVADMNMAGDPPECEVCYECGGDCNRHEHWCPYKDAWE